MFLHSPLNHLLVLLIFHFLDTLNYIDLHYDVLINQYFLKKAPNNIVENCVSFDNRWSGIVCDNWNGGCNGNIVRNNEVYGNNTDLGAQNPEQGAIASNGPDTEIYGNNSRTRNGR